MKRAWGKASRYFRQDLREIIAPTSLPDPPGTKPAHRLTLQDWSKLLRDTWRDYKASWKPAPSAKPSDEAKQPENGVSGAELREDLGVIGRGGAAQLRPILQRMYAERLAALQDAGRAFVDGYRSGLEKAKEDTLLEDLADKLWHQTAPEKRDGREADAGDQSSSGVQQAQGQSTQNHPR